MQPQRGCTWYLQIDNKYVSSIRFNLSTNSTLQTKNPRMDTVSFHLSANSTYTWQQSHTYIWDNKSRPKGAVLDIYRLTTNMCLPSALIYQQIQIYKLKTPGGILSVFICQQIQLIHDSNPTHICGIINPGPKGLYLIFTDWQQKYAFHHL